MKSAALILICVLQTIFRSVNGSEFHMKIDNPHEKIYGSPQGVGDFNPSDKSISLGICDNGDTELVKIKGTDSPVNPCRRAPIVTGRITPLSETFLTAIAAMPDNQETENMKFKSISNFSSHNQINENDNDNYYDKDNYNDKDNHNDNYNDDDKDNDDNDFPSAGNEADIIELVEIFNEGMDISDNNVIKKGEDVKMTIPYVTISDVESDDSDYELFVKKEPVEDFDYDRNDGSIFMNPRNSKVHMEVKEEVGQVEPEVTTASTATAVSSEENKIIKLYDYRTVDDIKDLSRSERVKLYMALHSQILDTMSFESPVKLSNLPPALFLLKISFIVRKIRGTLLNEEEFSNDWKLGDAIDECRVKAEVGDKYEIIELLYRAGKTKMADNLLYNIVIPRLRKLPSKPSSYLNYLNFLTVKGYFSIFMALLNEKPFRDIIRNNIKDVYLIFVIQTIFNDGCISDAEALEIMNILLEGRDRAQFFKKYGSCLVAGLSVKRGDDFLSIFPEEEFSVDQK